METKEDVSGSDLRHVIVTLDPEAEAEADEVERLARQLRAEIRQLDVESVSYGVGDAPVGAKGDLNLWTELLVTFGSAGSVLPVLLNAIQSWLERRQKGHRISVTIDGDTIELDGASSQERTELINAYIGRHS